MGAKHAKAAMDAWGDLPASAVLLLVRMALSPMDDNLTPQAYLGPKAKARALGRLLPDEPDVTDHSELAEDIRYERQAIGRAVERAVGVLTKHGAITLARKATPGNPPTYALNIGPADLAAGERRMEAAAVKNRAELSAKRNGKRGVHPTKSVGLDPTKNMGLDPTKSVGSTPTQNVGQKSKNLKSAIKEIGVEEMKQARFAVSSSTRVSNFDDGERLTREERHSREINRQTAALRALPSYNERAEVAA